MKITRIAHQFNGVHFHGDPRYIHYNAYLDTSGKIEIGKKVVISTGVILLTHDYSFTVGLYSINEIPKTDISFVMSISIGDNCFLGANAIILPGTIIGSNVIIGAGSVVSGVVKDNTIIAGNPAKKIADLNEWIIRKKNTIPKEFFHIDKN